MSEKVNEKFEEHLVKDCNNEFGRTFKRKDLLIWSTAPLKQARGQEAFYVSCGVYLIFRKK